MFFFTQMPLKSTKTLLKTADFTGRTKPITPTGQNQPPEKTKPATPLPQKLVTHLLGILQGPPPSGMSIGGLLPTFLGAMGTNKHLMNAQNGEEAPARHRIKPKRLQRWSQKLTTACLGVLGTCLPSGRQQGSVGHLQTKEGAAEAQQKAAHKCQPDKPQAPAG